MNITAQVLATINKLANNTWNDIVECDKALESAKTTLAIQQTLYADAQKQLGRATTKEERDALAFNVAVCMRDIQNTNMFIEQTKRAIADMEQDVKNLITAAKIINTQQFNQNAIKQASKKQQHQR